MAKYRVEIGGSGWSRGPVLDADTITAGRKLAEEYGTTADYAHIYKGGRLVATQRRDANGDGMRWFNADRWSPGCGRD